MASLKTGADFDCSTIFLCLCIINWSVFSQSSKVCRSSLKKKLSWKMPSTAISYSKNNVHSSVIWSKTERNIRYPHILPLQQPKCFIMWRDSRIMLIHSTIKKMHSSIHSLHSAFVKSSNFVLPYHFSFNFLDVWQLVSVLLTLSRMRTECCWYLQHFTVSDLYIDTKV